MKPSITAESALEKLRAGNARYLGERRLGDYTVPRRKQLCAEGQAPFAVVVCCSDSRVVPEALFDAGLGELFVIRVAGNVMGPHQLGSIEYAVSHLGCPLVVILGHTGCGAVAAALSGGGEGYIAALTQEIALAVGETADPVEASRKNVLHGVRTVREKLGGGFARTVGALYRLETGSVEFL